MNKLKFKKGEIVSATKTFNGEIITGEFQGYRLFNDEIPDTVVGVVHVSGDRSYDVDVTSIRHYESDDERTRKHIVKFIDEQYPTHGNLKEEKDKMLAYLEKQKEQDKCPEYCVRSHCIGCPIYEKQKEQNKCPEFCSGHCVGCEMNEQNPILEAFGFKVGDVVRLKDGDGRTHIIKSFEEIEGVHGPNFYHVEFEDNSARDGIYPGEEYPSGYYTQMEKFEEEQKPVEIDEDVELGLDRALQIVEKAKGNLQGYQTDDGIYECDHAIGTLKHILKRGIKQKPAEWSEEEKKFIKHCAELLDGQGEPMCALRLESLCPQKLDVSKLENYDPVEVLNKIKTEWPMAWEKVVGKQEWSEEDETKLRDVVRLVEDSGHVKSIREHYKKFLTSLPERFNLRSFWKPSEEQMEALKECGECKRCIKELYENLQKRYGTC